MKIQTEDKIISLVDWISLHEYFHITEHFPIPNWLNELPKLHASYHSFLIISPPIKNWQALHVAICELKSNQHSHLAITSNFTSSLISDH